MLGAADRVAVIVEDDLDLRLLVEATLTDAGFTCLCAGSGVDGIELVRRHQPVVTTLDLGLPGIDGLEVARRIRSFSSTYIIILSARHEEIDILTGLDAGADDYLTKPFRPRELRARVESMLRRDRIRSEETRREAEIEHLSPARPDGAEMGTPPAPPPGGSPEAAWLSHNGLRLSPEMRLAELDGRPLELTRSEFVVLAALMLADRRVISKSSLALDIRGDDDPGGYVSKSDQRVVESHLAHLRRKLDDSATAPRFIETVRGVGYRLTARQSSEGRTLDAS